MKDLLEEFRTCWLGLSGCCLHDDPETENRVEDTVEVFAFLESEPDGPSGGAITKLKNGNFAVFEEWQDYTGHG